MADLSSLIVGGIGSVAGVIALVYAHIANNNAKAAARDAANSVRVAKDSNALAVEANDLSKQSNNIALGAREIAQEANDIRRRGEGRETEQHDVHWVGQWDPGQPGRYLLWKRGDDDAYNVDATVTYDGQSVTQQSDAMTGDDRRLVFVFHGALADYQKEYSDRQARYGPAMSLPHGIGKRITWTTPLGTPKLEESSGLTTFDVYWR